MTRVYVDMVGDLFHKGHVKLFQKALEYGDELYVGIHSDMVVTSYKRKPILSMKDRIYVIKSCKYVSKVIPDAPLLLTKEYLTKHNIDLCIHAHEEGDECEKTWYKIPIELGKFKRVDYTPNISTTEIIERCKNI